MMSTFFDTKRSFATYVNYTEPMSYDEWMEIPSDHKAAALFVQYFNQILLAWDRATTYHTFWGDDEEAVETTIQYLMKNVPIIENDKKRFSPKYIYRVVYNALYCIVHDRASDKARREREISIHQVSASGDEYCLLDSICDTHQDVDLTINKSDFWKLIESCDEGTRELLDRILSSGKVPARMSCENEARLEVIKSALLKFAEAI